MCQWLGKATFYQEKPMTNKKKARAATDDTPLAERIDMNDPLLTEAEAVARNLGLTETPTEPAGEAA